MFGVPPPPTGISAFLRTEGVRTVTGSPIGSLYQLREMLDVTARHGVKGITGCSPIARANEELKEVEKNMVRYRVVRAN